MTYPQAIGLDAQKVQADKTARRKAARAAEEAADKHARTHKEAFEQALNAKTLTNSSV